VGLSNTDDVGFTIGLQRPRRSGGRNAAHLAGVLRGAQYPPYQ